MRKLKLDLESVAVQSFDTEAAAPAAGTVVAREELVTPGISCPDTCGISCLTNFDICCD